MSVFDTAMQVLFADKNLAIDATFTYAFFSFAARHTLRLRGQCSDPECHEKPAWQDVPLLRQHESH